MERWQPASKPEWTSGRFGIARLTAYGWTWVTTQRGRIKQYAPTTEGMAKCRADCATMNRQDGLEANQ